MRSHAISNQDRHQLPTIGFVPLSFPRDPVEINEFYEHFILGHVLQPLVEMDPSGNVIPSVASAWEISESGRKILFTLREDIKFSDGSQLSSTDVKATLERHLQGTSQSRIFLNGILKIAAPSPEQVVIYLKEPNAGILKALSRDQLGILPANWRFDPGSKEPIIGSGRYRLIHRHGGWSLVVNPNNDGAALSPIKEWQLVYFASANYDLPEAVFPDFIPYASKSIRDALKKNPHFPMESFTANEQPSLAQTSIWWNPHGFHYSSDLYRTVVMDTVSLLVDMAVTRRGGERSTGIIPPSVGGYLEECTHFTPLLESACLPGHKPQKIRFAARAGVFDTLFETDEAKRLLELRNIDAEVVNIPPAAMRSLRDQHFDVVMGGWAGGFKDPDGFIPVATQLLDIDFFEYLEELADLYKQARGEFDGTKRNKLFKALNQSLVTSRKMVPGWRIPLYSIERSSLDGMTLRN